MSYKKGDQFVIEIGDVLTDANNERVYKIKGFRSLVFDDNGLDRLGKFIPNPIESARKAGYRKGYKDALAAITQALYAVAGEEL